MASKYICNALSDIRASFLKLSLVGMLGWQDIRQRYRRSVLGPFWLTISMAIMIGTIGLVFSQIFKTPIHDFLPFLTAGIIFWTLISTILSEGCSTFILSDGIIKQLPIPLFVHVLRMIWRNLLILAHNVVIFPLLALFMSKPIGWDVLWVVPGLFLLILNMTWMALVLGVVCTRYRDLSQMVNSAIQVTFYLTPVMWMPRLLPTPAGFILNANPFYHLIEIVRAPLLGEAPAFINWIVCLGLATGGWILALHLYGRYKHRIAYWL